MRIDFNKQNFKGYKNIIANDVNFANMSIGMISAQLNDEGEKDLSKLKEIRTLQELPNEEIINDTFSCIYARNGKKGYIFFDDKNMYNSAQLLHLENSMPEKDFKFVEKLHMKAYSMLAGLTSRMMNDKEELKQDEKWGDVFQKAYYNLAQVFGDEEHSLRFVIDAEERHEISYQEIAAKINKRILKTMENFFR